MNPTSVDVLVALLTERMGTKELAKAVGVSYARASQIVRELRRAGFVVRDDGKVGLADTEVAALFRKVAKRFDPKKLLSDSAQDVAIALLSPRGIAGIERQTGLSYWTARRSLASLTQIGAAKAEGDKYRLPDDEELTFFLRFLNERQLRSKVEPYAEVVYAGPGCVLKKVPLAKEALGSLTAFSVFWRYGVSLDPISRYVVQPEAKDLGIEEALVHALVFSNGPVERTDCAVFYAKNRGRIDPEKARELARKFGVQDALVDLKGYVSSLAIPRPELFLPWEEYAEKARLYGLDPESLLPPPAYPRLAEELGRRVGRRVDVYVFGGEAMRIRRLKRATKDIDVVVEDVGDYGVLVKATRSMGYRTLGGDEISQTEARLNPSGIFVKAGSPRVDVFVGTIAGKLIVSSSMKARSDCEMHGNLRFCVLSNEDVFLLKSVTDREGDIYDMVELAKAPGFDWKAVLDELYAQERRTTARHCLGLLDSIEIIQERWNIRAPFYNRLVSHCIDHSVVDAVGRWKATTLPQIRALVDYPDYRLRSRIQRLVSDGMLVREDGRLKLPPSTSKADATAPR